MKQINLYDKNIREEIKSLKAGEQILLSGTVYTSRDAAHKRIMKAIEEGRELPFEIDGAAIYYAGPTPEREGTVIGSCGPTTSSRMDIFTPTLMEKGLLLTIGKGDRSEYVREAIKKHGGAYLCAIGGCGATACKCIKECEVVAYKDLGCESVKRLYVENFPLYVAYDSEGGSIFNKN